MEIRIKPYFNIEKKLKYTIFDRLSGSRQITWNFQTRKIFFSEGDYDSHNSSSPTIRLTSFLVLPIPHVVCGLQSWRHLELGVDEGWVSIKTEPEAACLEREAFISMVEFEGGLQRWGRDVWRAGTRSPEGSVAAEALEAVIADVVAARSAARHDGPHATRHQRVLHLHVVVRRRRRRRRGRCTWRRRRRGSSDVARLHGIARGPRGSQGRPRQRLRGRRRQQHQRQQQQQHRQPAGKDTDDINGRAPVESRKVNDILVKISHL